MTAGGRLLIIDDDPASRRRLEPWLAKKGYDYIFVRSPEAAAALLEHLSFDAVLHGHEFRYPLSFMEVKRPRVARLKFPDVMT